MFQISRRACSGRCQPATAIYKRGCELWNTDPIGRAARNISIRKNTESRCGTGTNGQHQPYIAICQPRPAGKNQAMQQTSLIELPAGFDDGMSSASFKEESVVNQHRRGCGNSVSREVRRILASIGERYSWERQRIAAT